MGTIQRYAIQVVTTLKEHGFVAYFAGGFVRDLLLGISSSDIDIATSAHPHEVAAIFPEHILVGAQFGVCIVRHKNHQFEVATFRQDIGYVDGRRPSEISLKSSPFEDAQRRDFTINGMFFDPITEEVLDYVNGKTDLEQKIIRTIGNPLERFEEDRLRMIRAVRFARRFGFTIEEQTKDAIIQLSHTLLPSVSMERIWQEFVKMPNHANFCEALLDMASVGLLGIIFPPLKHIDVEILRKRLKMLENVSEKVPAILILSQLFDEKDLSYVLGLAIYLRASKEETKSIEHFLELRTLFRADPTFSNRYEWAYLLANNKASASCEALIATLDPKVQKKSEKALAELQEDLAFHIDCIHKRKPLCVAKDLEPFGVRPGKRMGELLELADRIAIMENLRDKESVLERLKMNPLLITLNES